MRALWLLGVMALAIGCRGDQVDAARSALREFGGDEYGRVDAAIGSGSGAVDADSDAPDSGGGAPVDARPDSTPAPDGGVRFPDSGPAAPFPDSGVPFPDSGLPVPFPDSGVPFPDSGVPFPDSGVPFPDSGPAAPFPDSGVPFPDSGVPFPDSGPPPDAPDAPFCTTSDPAPACDGTCSCGDADDTSFGSCIVATTGDSPQPTDPLAIPDDAPRTCDAFYDSLVCVNGPSWLPPPLDLPPPDTTHHDVHHAHNHAAHADDDASLLAEGSEHDVCAWCAADPLVHAAPRAAGCTPLPPPTSPAAAARTLQCLWDDNKDWADAKRLFPADVALVDKSNLDLARRKIVEDLAKRIRDDHKVLTGISGSPGAASDVDVSVQYAELCADSDVAAAIKLANALFAAKVTAHPMTLNRALDVNFYFAREIPVRGMAALPAIVVQSEARSPNPAHLERLHEVAALVKVRQYMAGNSWPAFKDRFAPLPEAAFGYQGELHKAAEGEYARVAGQLDTRFRQDERARRRAGPPLVLRVETADLKIAAKTRLYEDALVGVQRIRNQRLATAHQITAGPQPPPAAMLTRLARETYAYEEAVVRSSFFADQAYYAKGSLLVVVARRKQDGGQDGNAAAGVAEPALTTAHFFQSMIEQTGDLFKDLGHSRLHDWKIGQTGLQASKYADRFFDGAIATLAAIRGSVPPGERANLDRLRDDLTKARAVNAALYRQRRAPYDAALEAMAVGKLRELGIRDIGGFRAKYRDWATKVIIFKRLSENRT